MPEDKIINQHWNPRSRLWCYMENGRIQKTSADKFEDVPVTKGKEAYQKKEPDEAEKESRPVEKDDQPDPGEGNLSGIGMF